ncbi:MAG: hypothetical protein LBB61_05900 [Treponema sp.]|nr:hypothetical protein [Treponema sp.]
MPAMVWLSPWYPLPGCAEGLPSHVDMLVPPLRQLVSLDAAKNPDLWAAVVTLHTALAVCAEGRFPLRA